MKENELRKGRYKHSKSGKEYLVIGVALHSENLEPLVVYRALYKNPPSKLWVRPLSMFTEKVKINGKKVQRFIFISEK